MQKAGIGEERRDLGDGHLFQQSMTPSQRFCPKVLNQSHSSAPIDTLRFPLGSLRLFAGILDFGLASYGA